MFRAYVAYHVLLSSYLFVHNQSVACKNIDKSKKGCARPSFFTGTTIIMINTIYYHGAQAGNISPANVISVNIF
jgi:hypothetical protein